MNEMVIYPIGENSELEKAIKDSGLRNKSLISSSFYHILDKLGLYPVEKLVERRVKKLRERQSKLEGHIEEYSQKIKDERERDTVVAGVDSTLVDKFREQRIEAYVDILINLEQQYTQIDIILSKVENPNLFELGKDLGLYREIKLLRGAEAKKMYAL